MRSMGWGNWLGAFYPPPFPLRGMVPSPSPLSRGQGGTFRPAPNGGPDVIWLRPGERSRFPGCSDRPARMVNPMFKGTCDGET